MSKASKIARGGLYTALTVLLLYIASVTPTSKLSLLTAASAIIPLSILTTGIRNTIAVYGASAILTFLISQKGLALSYSVFFGLYGFVKFYVEAMNKVIYEILIKLAYFNLSLFIVYKLYTALFTESISSKLPVYFFIIAAQAAFILYDYVMTSIINYIKTKFVKVN